MPDDTAPRRGTDAGLSTAELRRYARHLVLPEVGREGQEALARARVLVVGAGGLGAPVSLYLAAAGVGTLGLVDDDLVDESNLHRQVLFSHRDVGRLKVDVASEQLQRVNPHVAVEQHPIRLNRHNAFDVIGDYDVVVDGTDNFPARYLINDACVLLGKPVVYGAILRWEGQASLFAHEDGPCYRCLFREPPPPGLVPSCAEAGVLGALPGVIGSIQALETIKLLLGQGDLLAGRLIILDALSMRFREVGIPRNPACPICGDSPTLTELIDYEEFCGVESVVPEVTATALAQELSSPTGPLLVDVREVFEWEGGSLEAYGAVHIPLATLEDRAHELPSERDIVVYCQSGARSARAVRALRAAGFHRVRNLDKGYSAWASEVGPPE
jgi:molybdopterin/thiamine biosynthesis adenylyltransferase/rhodanese-related sulfurtransferase